MESFRYERAMRGERELERRQPQVEREHVQARRQQVERWQSGVLSRNYRSSPLASGWRSFDSKPFFQPPTIRPISSVFSDISRYFLLSKAFNSQETCRKNLRTSIFFIIKSMVDNFSLWLWYLPMKRFSRISINKISILSPNVYRKFLGKSFLYPCQSLYNSTA